MFVASIGAAVRPPEGGDIRYYVSYLAGRVVEEGEKGTRFLRPNYESPSRDLRRMSLSPLEGGGLLLGYKETVQEAEGGPVVRLEQIEVIDQFRSIKLIASFRDACIVAVTIGRWSFRAEELGPVRGQVGTLLGWCRNVHKRFDG